MAPSQKRLTKIAIGLVVIVGLFIWTAPSAKYKAIINDDGTAWFFSKGWFKNDYRRIKLINGNWQWDSPDGWKQIAAPYESKYNDNYILVLDRDGRIYIRSVDRTEENPLRVIDGKWHWRSAYGEWIEVPFDLPNN